MGNPIALDNFLRRVKQGMELEGLSIDEIYIRDCGAVSGESSRVFLDAFEEALKDNQDAIFDSLEDELAEELDEYRERFQKTLESDDGFTDEE